VDRFRKFIQKEQKYKEKHMI